MVQLLMCTCDLLKKKLVIYPTDNKFRKIISFLAQTTLCYLVPRAYISKYQDSQNFQDFQNVVGRSSHPTDETVELFCTCFLLPGNFEMQ